MIPCTPTYRKKPVIIEAERLTERTEIETLEGTMVGNPGDWLITGIKGEKYPCKDDIFRETYEIVPNCSICSNFADSSRICDQHGECLFALVPYHPFAPEPEP
ncbi:MAG: hypothetical protein WC277_11070 [Bacilli bacterium]